ncbi:MAG: hypothetical protein MUC65_05485, partial [Pontiellaceae bacterium]|nr:hypothetical protein [Pontiellaceae bacterium]
MKPSGNQPLKWELARERFQIEDRFPPKELRPEKRIGDILTGILKTENTETEANALPVAISE